MITVFIYFHLSNTINTFLGIFIFKFVFKVVERMKKMQTKKNALRFIGK